MVLNNYTKGIIERLNHEALQDPENDFVKVLDGTVGEYLTNRKNHFLDVFLATAEGEYLNLYAKIFGLFRREGETDDELRQRILTDATLIQRTTDFEKLDCQLWIYQESVVDDNNTLTSRNTYLKDLHDDEYFFICSGNDSEYIQSKFLLNDILFVE